MIKSFTKKHPIIFVFAVTFVLLTVSMLLLNGGLAFGLQANENKVQTVEKAAADLGLPTTSATLVPENYALYGTFDRASGEDIQYPALTDSEKERCIKLIKQYKSGKRPKSAAVADPSKTGFAIVPLKESEYKSLAQYVFLPNRILTDEELLQIIDYFSQKGIDFNSETLDESNCMRGGCIEVNRNRTEEENKRFSTLSERYKREGLRPQGKITNDPSTGGIAEVKLYADAHSGLDSFTFYPLRALTDEEILQLIDAHLKNSLYNTAGFKANWEADEAKCRAIAEKLFDMEASTELENDGYTPGDAVRPDTYSAHFATAKQDGKWRWYLVQIDLSSGQLIQAVTMQDDERLVVQSGDISMHVTPDEGIQLPEPDLKDSKWTDAAKMFVLNRLADGRAITKAEAYGTCGYNAGNAVDVAVDLEDGSSYSIAVLIRNMEITSVQYYAEGLDVAKLLKNRG